MKVADNDFKEGVHFYYNEDGNTVFTEKYHLQRGYCCGNGCLHCPYNYKMVAEPMKSRLIAKRKNEK
ncbi:MAG: DUF5522 domain-containing protein [Bacteroidota bacterium]|nr:DUF5522 domain-containing protein [Bacteroidota bacterium]